MCRAGICNVVGGGGITIFFGNEKSTGFSIRRLPNPCSKEEERGTPHSTAPSFSISDNGLDPKRQKQVTTSVRIIISLSLFPAITGQRCSFPYLSLSYSQGGENCTWKKNLKTLLRKLVGFCCSLRNFELQLLQCRNIPWLRYGMLG